MRPVHSPLHRHCRGGSQRGWDDRKADEDRGCGSNLEGGILTPRFVFAFPPDCANME